MAARKRGGLLLHRTPISESAEIVDGNNHRTKEITMSHSTVEKDSVQPIEEHLHDHDTVRGSARDSAHFVQRQTGARIAE